jgi:hypothetical protein
MIPTLGYFYFVKAPNKLRLHHFTFYYTERLFSLENGVLSAKLL